MGGGKDLSESWIRGRKESAESKEGKLQTGKNRIGSREKKFPFLRKASVRRDFRKAS